jgi:hypothetical protein
VHKPGMHERNLQNLTPSTLEPATVS